MQEHLMIPPHDLMDLRQLYIDTSHDWEGRTNANINCHLTNSDIVGLNVGSRPNVTFLGGIRDIVMKLD